MIDERFSAKEFQKTQGSPSKRKQLLSELEREIVAAIDTAAAPAFDRLGARLCDLGHQLVSKDDEVTDNHSRGYSFRMLNSDGSESDDSLHIHLDFVATAAWTPKEES